MSDLDEKAIEAAAKAAREAQGVAEFGSWQEVERPAMVAVWGRVADTIPRSDPMDMASRAFEGGWFARAAYLAARGPACETCGDSGVVQEPVPGVSDRRKRKAEVERAMSDLDEQAVKDAAATLRKYTDLSIEYCRTVAAEILAFYERGSPRRRRGQAEGDSHWATVVIEPENFEPREATAAEKPALGAAIGGAWEKWWRDDRGWAGGELPHTPSTQFEAGYHAALAARGPVEDAAAQVCEYITSLDPAALTSDLEIEWWNRAKAALGNTERTYRSLEEIQREFMPQALEQDRDDLELGRAVRREREGVGRL